MENRQLTQAEINLLEKQGCRAENWEIITVKPDFNPANIHNVTFAGAVEIGNCCGVQEVKPGCLKNCGIYDSYIRNCTIADNVYIANVKNLLNYTIEKDVIIENVGDLIVTGETTFGNGTELDILNEGGGRILPIYDRLNAQIAYMIVIYKHDPALQKALKKLVSDYAAERKSSRGVISQGVRIYNSNIIRNVQIGEKATVSGALLLEDGTIAGSKVDPVYIGEGVIAKHFIIQSGVRVDSSAVLDKCFVGQGTRLGKQFSAENSAFFANCECFHGEAVSVFAGPYTVTHHKSNFLIAGMFSFFNAGSGTNQSNHMYKLGPLHQGVLDRGSKTGSYSYLVWPARIGIFSVVIGKHFAHLDTSELPFSYLIESEDKSILKPAMNLFTSGTRRDIIKWPARDRRKDTDRLDLINFDFFSPYIIEKALRAIEILHRLDESSQPDQEFVKYQGAYIRKSVLKGAIQNYELIPKIFYGNLIMQKIGSIDNLTWDKVKNIFTGEADKSAENWEDLSGMFATHAEINKINLALRENRLNSIVDLECALRDVHQNYEENTWQFCLNLLFKRFATNALTSEQVCQLLDEWQASVVRFNNLVLKDAEKEFAQCSRVGYGIDGDAIIRDQDFEAVRGTFAENKFVVELKKESEEAVKKVERICAALRK
jgi:NDP-sugar pyrophosphorylase family protein